MSISNKIRRVCAPVSPTAANASPANAVCVAIFQVLHDNRLVVKRCSVVKVNTLDCGQCEMIYDANVRHVERQYCWWYLARYLPVLLFGAGADERENVGADERAKTFRLRHTNRIIFYLNYLIYSMKLYFIL